MVRVTQVLFPGLTDYRKMCFPLALMPLFGSKCTLKIAFYRLVSYLVNHKLQTDRTKPLRGDCTYFCESEAVSVSSSDMPLVIGWIIHAFLSFLCISNFLMGKVDYWLQFEKSPNC